MKRKRLLIQLSIVSSVLGLGGVGLYQGVRAFRGEKAATQEVAENSDSVDGQKPAAMIPDDASGNSFSSLAPPSPEETVIRGNNDEPAVPPPAAHIPQPGLTNQEAESRYSDVTPAAFPPAAGVSATLGDRAIDEAAASAGDRFASSAASLAPPSGVEPDGPPNAETNSFAGSEGGNALRGENPPPFAGQSAESTSGDRFGAAAVGAAIGAAAGAIAQSALPPNSVHFDEQAPAAAASRGGQFQESPATAESAPIATPFAGNQQPQGNAADAASQFSSRSPAALGAAAGAGLAAGAALHGVAEQTVPEQTVPEQTVPEQTVPEQAAAERAQETAEQAGLAENGTAGATSGVPPATSPGVPGPRELEGAQQPSVTLEKIAPQEIQVGIPAKFDIRLRNVGQVDAHQVVVRDQIPQGTRFIDASSNYQLQQDGSISWQLQTLKPGEETLLSLQVMPLEEGEIGSVAQVAFQAQATARTICTRPQLQIQHTAPAKVLIGENVTFNITLSNPGSGAATNVILEEDVPEGLQHDAGDELEYVVGTLRPGETKELALTLRAQSAGIVHNRLRLTGNGNLSAEDELDLEVIAPQLQLAVEGPSLRYLNRKAKYAVSISNPGTAPARNLELIAYLPKGLEFESADNKGHYDAQRHAVLWSLEELPAKQVGDVQLVLIPKETGEQKIRTEGRADLELQHAVEKTVVVDARPELQFTITDSADPIEVGSDTTYQIRVTNAGAKTATNVQIAAALPPGMTLAKADGPTRGTINGQQALYEPLARLAPGANVVFQIQATGAQAGDHRIQVQISNDDNQNPIRHEESTRVYQDDL